jgi:site-specific DNA-methyltransferase (adenine-specific)
MGKRWDYDVPSVEIWAECLRVLKPGGHLLAFAGTRTQHRMAVRIEDAGFEIRDMIAWVYGSGFPKSLDVSKAIDKAAGHARETEYEPNHKNATFGAGLGGGKHGAQSDPPVTDAAREWQGWGTALKPALEPITMARKPLTGTVAANVLEYGTGAINVDGCRVEHVTVGDGNLALNPHLRTYINGGNGGNIISHEDERRVVTPHTAGRWPANLIHDGSDEVLVCFPVTTSGKPCGKRNATTGFSSGITPGAADLTGFGDTGSAARFFYTAKATKAERQGVTHPTVKPIELMAYLCRLVTPAGGTVLDPFMGSGTTIKAAFSEGFNAIGIERDPAYFEMAQHRMDGAQMGLSL